MTEFRVFTPALSANEVFKSQYNRALRWSGLGAVLCTAMMVWLSPQYTPQPYQLRQDAILIQNVEVIYEIPEPPKVAAAPIIQPEIIAAPVDDPDAFDTIDIPTWEFYPGPTHIYDNRGDEGFVASSSKPRLVSQAKPHYPEVARLAQVEGTVIVKVLVDVDGSVKAAEVVAGVHPLLNKAALKAAQRCVFLPGQQRAMPVPAWVAVPYNFRLR